MKNLVKFAIAAVILGGVNLNANDTGDKMQTLIKKEEQKFYEPNDKIFAGGLPKVRLMMPSTSYANVGVALVTFPKGVRTAWHTHPAGQHLIVTSGTIYTGTHSGILQVAKPGDVVLCPPDVKHWHGAGLKEHGEHIALTFEKDGKNVTWMEHLTQDEYKNFINKADENSKNK